MAVDPAAAIGIIGAIIILGVLITRTSERFRLPGILFLLVLGIFLGPVSGFYNPLEFPDLLQAIVTFALVIVLFDAGYDIKLKRLKKELLPATTLSLLAMILSIIIAAGLAILFFKFSWQNALLLGALLASTDITVVAPLMRAFEIKPALKDMLSLEAAINSVLTIIIASTIVSLGVVADTFMTATKTFLYQIFVGVGLGVIFGYLLLFVIKHLKVEQRPELLSIGIILLIYALSQLVGASGIFAVFIAGIILGNAKEPLKKVISSFESNIALLIIIFVYVILGAMLRLDVILSIGLLGLLLAIIVVFSRAPAIWLYKRGWGAEEKFLFLIGPRGTTCIVLALFFMSQFPDPNLILGLVFAVVIITVIAASMSHTILKKETEELAKPAKK